MVKRKWFLLGKRSVFRTCAALAMVIPSTAFGVLGGSEASVQADQSRMQAQVQTSRVGAYTVHELQGPSGTVIREYAANGTVFAVAWEGHWPPDMQQLLGSYFETYRQALQAQTEKSRGRGPVYIEVPGLVVNAGGHPRSFKGRAFVPEMVPQGMKAEAIR